MLALLARVLVLVLVRMVVAANVLRAPKSAQLLLVREAPLSRLLYLVNSIHGGRSYY